MSEIRTPDPDSSSKTPPNGPFFTVLIPTMNRPYLLEAALKTALWQTFKDFEIIVSDNSNNEEIRQTNYAAVRKYEADPRVHYIRPDSWMNMPDHWEFASRHASGRYVLILTDRFVMRPIMLEFLHSKINKLPEENKIIAWNVNSAFNDQSGVLSTEDFTGNTEVMDSKKLVRDYAKLSNWRYSLLFSNRLPRMLNSCYRFDVAQKIREDHGRLFIPVSPDYTSAFLLLAYTDNMVFLDLPLSFCHGNQSTGRKSAMYGIEEYASTMGDVDVFAGIPVRLNVVINIVVRDLLAIKNLVGVRFSDVHVDWVGYYTSCYSEIILKERLGSSMDIDSMYEQWWGGVGKLLPEQQARIRENVRELDRNHPSFIGLRRFVVRMGLDPVYFFIMGKIRRIRQRLSGKPVYANVFDAAIHSDNILSDFLKKENTKEGRTK